MPLATADAASPYLLLGVMAAPAKPLLREQWRQWGTRFRAFQNSVRVRFVLGDAFYESGVFPGESTKTVETEKEAAQSGDLVWVAGRDKLPHVGKVTEKSAAFWQAAVQLEPSANWYCKCDDDTLVHLDRIEKVLRQIERERPGQPVYFGHMKWRGWDVEDRFQACGGTWGDAIKTAEDILEGGVVHGATRYPPCPNAAGPYPYMSGGMVCMSRAMAATMATDAHFAHFLSTARVRNTQGEPCKRPLACAQQPEATHMWHHEDAGVGYNVFRALVAANASGHYIAVPGHYNDPGIIERTAGEHLNGPLDANDEYWSTRSLFVHGIKTPLQFRMALYRWNLTRADADLTLECHSCQTLPKGVNRHYGNWKWARVPCKTPEWSTDAAPAYTGRFCNVAMEPFRCCSFPWQIPPEMQQAGLARVRLARSKLPRVRRGGKGKGKGAKRPRRGPNIA